MKHLGLREQLQAERRRSEALEAELLLTKANADYIAMMTDVDIDEAPGGEEAGYEE